MNLADADRLAIVEWAGRHPEIRRIWLFGSRALANNRPDSDVDLGIEIEQAPGDDNPFVTWMNWIEDYKDKPALSLSVEVDLHWYGKGVGLKRVGPAIEDHGVLIYNRQKKS